MLIYRERVIPHEKSSSVMIIFFLMKNSLDTVPLSSSGNIREYRLIIFVLVCSVREYGIFHGIANHIRLKIQLIMHIIFYFCNCIIEAPSFTEKSLLPREQGCSTGKHKRTNMCSQLSAWLHEYRPDMKWIILAIIPCRYFVIILRRHENVDTSHIHPFCIPTNITLTLMLISTSHDPSPEVSKTFPNPNSPSCHETEDTSHYQSSFMCS